eukprot:14898572-Alexandrium_andersonii.AAC.1
MGRTSHSAAVGFLLFKEGVVSSAVALHGAPLYTRVSGLASLAKHLGPSISGLTQLRVRPRRSQEDSSQTPS